MFENNLSHPNKKKGQQPSFHFLTFFSYKMTSDICRFESASQLHDHGDGHVHSHAGHDAHEHGHTHEQMDSPGFYQDRPKAIYDKRDWSERAFTVGIGG